MKGSWKNYSYAPRPLDRKPARSTPFDQTKAQASSESGRGKYGGLGSKVSGGDMNGGGKRRPGHDARKGID